MDNNKWVLAKIKKYEKLKGDSLDGWQECTEEKHKSMWEAYNLAYGQILSDLNDLIEYIAEVQEEEIIDRERKAFAEGIGIGIDAQKSIVKPKNELPCGKGQNIA